MAWLGIVALGLIAEVSVIIALGRGTTRRYEIGQPRPHDLLGPRYGTTPPQPTARTALPSPRDIVDGERTTLPIPDGTPG